MEMKPSSSPFLLGRRHGMDTGRESARGRDAGYLAAKARAILSSVMQGVGAGRHDPLVVVAGQPHAGGASFLLLPLLPLLLAPRDSGGVEGGRGGDTPAAAGTRPRATRRGHWRAGARSAVDGGQERQERDEARGGGGERRPPSPPHDARLTEALSAEGGGGGGGVELDVRPT